MKFLFDKLSWEVSKMTTRTYSTSFSLGIYFLSSRFRHAIYGIYGFVRFADEIVDSFKGYDQRSMLAKFTTQTYEAIHDHISINPVLHSFQQVVHDYQISTDLIDSFLASMEMDIEGVRYTPEKYSQYILGSAEVVGLMCLRVFCEGDEKLYDSLKPYAMKLGAAFQKVNFLRDMKDDYQLLGRIYFPGVKMTEFTGEAKKLIEKDIENDFNIALAGIRKLPSSSKGGVYLAYVYYQSLFRKIKKLSPDKVLSERIRIDNGTKLRLMLNSLFEYKMNLV